MNSSTPIDDTNAFFKHFDDNPFHRYIGLSVAEVADDFARLLTYTRLVAASMLATAEGAEHYEKAKALEAMRTARMRSRDVEL